MKHASATAPSALDRTEAIIGNYVAPEETVLWSGRPHHRLRWRPEDWIMMPLTILWDWRMIHVLRGFPLLVSLPMLLFIVHVTIGRFFTDAWHRSRLIYVLTDRRALIITQGISEAAASIALSSPVRIVLRRSGNGRGTVSFGPFAFSPWGGGTLRSAAPSPAFQEIADATGVYEMALDAQTRA